MRNIIHGFTQDEKNGVVTGLLNILFLTVTLLNIPGFIERLCKLATRKVSEATGANFLQELEDWYTWLDNALVLDALMQMATEEAEQSSTGKGGGHL